MKDFGSDMARSLLLWVLILGSALLAIGIFIGWLI